jgi:hypothetical protein
MAVVKLGSSQQVRVAAKFLDRRGNPAPVQDAEWLVDKPDVLDIQRIDSPEDEPACLVKALGPLGTATLTLSADGDPGDGITALIGSLEFQVGVGNAVRVQLDPGAPEEQPEEPEAVEEPPVEEPIPDDGTTLPGPGSIVEPVAEPGTGEAAGE